MKIFILSLGTIVETNFQKSISAFQAAAEKKGIPFNLQDILFKLNPLLRDFNLKMTTEDFKNKFLEILPIQAKDFDFDAAWNAMCTVDDAALEVVKLIKKVNEDNKEINFIIMSDSNPIHFDFLSNKLAPSGLDMKEIYTTFGHNLSKRELLLKIIETQKTKVSNTKFIVVLGNTDSIQVEQLKEIVDKNAKDVSDVPAIEIMKLPNSRLTALDIKKMADLELKEGISKVLQFSTQTMPNKPIDEPAQKVTEKSKFY